MIKEDLKAEKENKAPHANSGVYPPAFAPSASTVERNVDTRGPRSWRQILSPLTGRVLLHFGF